MNSPSILNPISKIALALGALLALGFALAPRAEASHQYAIYRGTGDYIVKYRHGDPNSPTGDQCQTLKFVAQFYLIQRQDSDFSIVYLEPATRRYGIVQNYDWDCFGGNTGFQCARNRREVAMFECQEGDIDINNDATDDARRCEILCLDGNFREGGFNLPAPFAGNDVEFPFTLQGTYCRVTCYDPNDFPGGFWYREATFGRRDYSYLGPYENTGNTQAGVACVTGKLRCSIDVKLTAQWRVVSSDLADAETAIANDLNGRGWTSVGTRDVSDDPFDFLAVEPFCP